MNFKNITTRIALQLIFILTGIGQLSAYPEEKRLPTGILDPKFKTLKVGMADNFFAPPVLTLGSGERLIVNFDEIGDEYSDLQYRLIHCNADWKPSRLVENEYLSGFNNIDVDDYAYSVNTFIHYVNYMISVPDEEAGILVSGNYLLEVFDRDDPERVVIRVPFRVVENLTDIKGVVSTRTDKGTNDRWQQLSLDIAADGYEIGNPYQDLIVEVEQNSRKETSRRLKSPLRVTGGNIIYEHAPELIFPASNEYRRFESISNLFPGMHVDSLHYEGSNYHVWLTKDEPRVSKSYEYDSTQHGRFLVREYNATDSNLGADYITVHFSLDSPRITGGDIYVDGEFTHGNYDRTNRMVYNRERGVYELQMPLKQGVYNYQYVFIPESGGNASTSPIEGDKYETRNEYTVYVYHRPPGARYDRLMGVSTVMFQ